MNRTCFERASEGGSLATDAHLSAFFFALLVLFDHCSIKGDLINEVSIKLQFNNDAKWTKALKYMLTNLKFLLAWCSTRKSAP